LQKIIKSETVYINAYVYGEFGRYPLYINIYIRIIKYWIKVVNTDNIFLEAMYNIALNYNNIGCVHRFVIWVTNMKTILNAF
jgi:hypothetical protein